MPCLEFMKTVVVIPTYNEAKNIVLLLREVLKQDAGLEVLVVDDYSPDRTWMLVEQEARASLRVHLLLRRGERGRGRAGAEGFRKALEMGAERIVEMDGDFSHDPADLVSLIEASDDADLAIGSRYISGGSDGERGVSRRLVSSFARRYLRCVLGLGVHDPTSGYRCFREDAVRSLLSGGVSSVGPFFITETLFYCCRKGMRIVEVPISFRKRKSGRSKLGVMTLVKYLLQALKLRLKSRLF